MADPTWRDAIIKVLAETTEPLHYTEIAKRVADRGIRKKLGATPAKSVAAEFSISLNEEGEEPPFEWVSRGVYRLRNAEGAGASKHQHPDATSEETEPETGLINAFGMYWQREAVLWASPKLLGQQQPGSTAVNFAEEFSFGALSQVHAAPSIKAATAVPSVRRGVTSSDPQ